MRYPVLTYTGCAELAEQLVAGEDPAVEPHAEWVGRGAEVDLRPIAEAAEEITRAARQWTDRDRDRFEGKASIRLLEVLAEVPAEVLDDRGFWRFLSLHYFWEFIAWREEGPFSAGNYLKYVNAATNTESVLPRMYVRAKAVGGRAHGDLASAVRRGTDFWRSHVVRVRTGSAPPLTRAFARRQSEERLTTRPLREAAKRVNRVWANVVLHLYDDDEASELMESAWNEIDD